MMQCRNCGASLLPAAKVCPNCGTMVPYNTPGSNPQYDATIPAQPAPPSGPAAYGTPSTAYGSPLNQEQYGVPSSNPYNSPSNPGQYGVPASSPYDTLGSPGQYGGPANPYSPPSNPEQPGYGAQGSYGSFPQQTPYGAVQPGQYGSYPPYPGGPQPFPPPQPPQRKSKAPLIIGIVLGVLVLACIGAIAVAATANRTANNNGTRSQTPTAAATAASTPTQDATTPTATTSTSTSGSPSGAPVVQSAAAIITDPQTASEIDTATAEPKKPATTFTAGSYVYVTFKLNTKDLDFTNQKKYYVQSRFYVDGVLGRDRMLTLDKAYASGYFAVQYLTEAKGAIELYWCTTSNCSDRQLAQYVTFTVVKKAAVPSANPLVAINNTDRDRRY